MKRAFAVVVLGLALGRAIVACGESADAPPANQIPIDASTSPMDASQMHDDASDASVNASDASDASPNTNTNDASDASSNTSDASDAAAPITIAIVNPSFEDPVLAPNTFNASAPPMGWQAYGTAIDYNGRSLGALNPNGSSLYLDPVPHGQNVAVTFLTDNLPTPTEAGLQQTLTAVLETSTTYTLRVDVGNLNPNGGPWNFTGFPGYRVELLAGGVVIASDNDTLRPGEGRFLRSVITAVIPPTHARQGQPLGIRLINRDASAGIEVNFDDVRLSAQR